MADEAAHLWSAAQLVPTAAGGPQAADFMQKVLTQMNVQLANVISDLSGATGQAIVKAILEGNAIRMPWRRCGMYGSRRAKRRSPAVWRGTGRKVCCLCSNRSRMATSFARSRSPSAMRSSTLQQRADRSVGADLPEETREGRRRRKKGNAPQFDMREALFRMAGVDLTRIDGIDVMTAATVISEAGVGHEPVANGASFRLLVTALSG